MSILRKVSLVSLFGPALVSSYWSQAADYPGMDEAVRHLDDEWAHIKYQVNDRDEQFKDLQALAIEAAAVVGRYPGQVQPLLWNGIIESEEAAKASIIHKLGLATAARKLFEKAEAIDKAGPGGAVAMSLGVIYYHVPGFPMGFGDNNKARSYLETALAIDPNGLDTNYFYGDFLARRGEVDQAKRVLAHALDAPENPARPVWDAGRRAEVKALIAKIDHRTAGI
jgi:tetratricopeptide (TPR) repeat protein